MHEIPETSVLDAPLHTICINDRWWSHVSGVIRFLTDLDYWNGTDDERADAADQIYQLLSVGELADECGGQMAPTHATMWHDEATVLTGGALVTFSPATAPYAKTDHYYNVAAYQSTFTDGDSFMHPFTLASGDYNFGVLGLFNNAHGMLDWYLDDVEIVSAQDWYFGSIVQNRIFVNAVNVPTSGAHILKGVVNGKNASSFAYLIALTKYWFERIP